jgi:chorismate mutase/prephenate dehydratase
MAKKKKLEPPKKPTASRVLSVKQLERQLERADKDLLRSLNDRAKLALQLAKSRVSHNEPGFDPVLEQQLLKWIANESRGPLSESALQAIFREVISGSRALHKPLRVAYLGPEYSYSYLATIERFGTSAELCPVATIAAVFEELNRGHSEYGVVPLENSTDGRVADTLNMFARLPVRICGEVQLRIRHNLLAKCPRDEVQEVCSKPQALSQCRDWLAQHLPWARTVEMTSTTAAAQLAGDKQGTAAIASMFAASTYGLDVIASSIEDNENNVTRFAVIGGDTATRTGRDKTALMLEIAHQPGALADVMAVFKRGRLNLTWIESFPIKGSQSEYLFFVESDGHERDAKLRRALEALSRKTVRLEVLGSYAKSDPVG